MQIHSGYSDTFGVCVSVRKRAETEPEAADSSVRSDSPSGKFTLHVAAVYTVG